MHCNLVTGNHRTGETSSVRLHDRRRRRRRRRRQQICDVL
jgi:hypothetical protein